MKNYLDEVFDLNHGNLVSTLDELCLWSAHFGIKLLETVTMKKDIKILDVGFGTGFPLLELAQRFGNTCEVTGIDPWIKGVDRTRKKIDQYGLKNVKIINGYAEEIPSAGNYFDLIVSNNGLNNVESADKAYTECYRVCKPGGQFVFTFNLPLTMIEFYQVLEQVLTELNLTEEIDRMKKHISFKRKTIEQTMETLAEVGFSTKRINTSSFTWRYVDGTTMLNHYFIKLAFLSSWKTIVKSTDLRRVFDEVETKLNKIALEQGEFDMTIPFAVFDCRK